MVAETRVKPLNALNDWNSPIDGWQQRDVSAYLRPMSRQEVLGRRSPRAPSETRSQPSPSNVRSGVLRWLPPAPNTATSPQSSPLIAHTDVIASDNTWRSGFHYAFAFPWRACVSITRLRFHSFRFLTVYFLFLFVDGYETLSGRWRYYNQNSTISSWLDFMP